MVVGQRRVLGLADVTAGAVVHGGVLELGRVMQESVVGFHGDGVGCDEGGRGADLDDPFWQRRERCTRKTCALLLQAPAWGRFGEGWEPFRHASALTGARTCR